MTPEDAKQYISTRLRDKKTHLRDQFAMAALTGILQDTCESPKEIAKECYEIAEAMLRTRRLYL